MLTTRDRCKPLADERSRPANNHNRIAAGAWRTLKIASVTIALISPRSPRLRKIQCFIFLLACIVLPSHQSSAQAPPKQIAVHAGRLIDVRSGQVTNDAYILISGERIVSVGTSAPPGVNIVDMSKFTIVPGLIDAHGHTLDDPTNQSDAAFLMTSAPEATVRGVNNLQVWLNHGFTAVRDACEPYSSYPQFALRDGVAKGLITGPRIVAAGSCISLAGGHGDPDYLSPDKAPLYSPNLADTPDDINHVVRAISNTELTGSSSWPPAASWTRSATTASRS